MKKSIKIFGSVLLALVLVMVMSTTAFAATLHKINGIYSGKGAGDSYTTTISRTCNEIRVKGVTYDSVTDKLVNVHIYRQSGWQELLVASITNVRLDNKEHTMQIYDPYVNNLTAGTYTVRITTSDTKPYDVSTYFYYWLNSYNSI